MHAASSWLHRPGKEWLLSLESRLVEARLRLWGLSRVTGVGSVASALHVGYRGNYLGVIEQRKDGQQHLRYFTRGGCLGDMLLRGFLLSISALSTSLCDD